MELSRVCEQVWRLLNKKVQTYLSTRGGAWILNKVGDNGCPGDTQLNIRIKLVFVRTLPTSVINSFMQHKLNSRFDHERFDFKPRHWFQRFPLIASSTSECSHNSKRRAANSVHQWNSHCEAEHSRVHRAGPHLRRWF